MQSGREQVATFIHGLKFEPTQDSLPEVDFATPTQKIGVTSVPVVWVEEPPEFTQLSATHAPELSIIQSRHAAPVAEMSSCSLASLGQDLEAMRACPETQAKISKNTRGMTKPTRCSGTTPTIAENYFPDCNSQKAGFV